MNMNLKNYLNEHPDVNDDEWNDDDDDENSIILDDVRSNTPMLARSPRKNQTIRRRQTIGTTQGQQYVSRPQHQTPLKQLQAMFWPARQSHHSTINSNHQSNEDEQQIPMVTKKQTVRRSSSVREKPANMINENLNERKKRHRNQRHSNTIAIV